MRKSGVAHANPPSLSGLDPELLADPVRRLRVWMAAHELKQWEAARRLKVDDAVLSRVMSRRDAPGAELRSRIEKLTGGFVTFAPVGEVSDQLVNQNANLNEAPRAAAGGGVER